MKQRKLMWKKWNKIFKEKDKKKHLENANEFQ